MQHQGGVGKSTISNHLIPFIHKDTPSEKIHIFEIDDNNDARLLESKINKEAIKIKKIDEAIVEATLNKLYIFFMFLKFTNRLISPIILINI